MNWSKKSVLVTGGTGFLGSRVVSLLKEKGVKLQVDTRVVVGVETKAIMG